MRGQKYRNRTSWSSHQCAATSTSLRFCPQLAGFARAAGGDSLRSERNVWTFSRNDSRGQSWIVAWMDRPMDEFAMGTTLHCHFRCRTPRPKRLRYRPPLEKQGTSDPVVRPRHGSLSLQLSLLLHGSNRAEDSVNRGFSIGCGRESHCP
jgi:hypothetical protein